MYDAVREVSVVVYVCDVVESGNDISKKDTVAMRGGEEERQTR